MAAGQWFFPGTPDKVVQEEFEDTKRVIRIHKLKDRQHNMWPK